MITWTFEEVGPSNSNPQDTLARQLPQVLPIELTDAATWDASDNTPWEFVGVDSETWTFEEAAS